MSGQGTTKQPGPSTATTVVRLQPVTYRLTFIYLGNNRIRRDAPGNSLPVVTRPPPYRCRYDVTNDLLTLEGDRASLTPCARVMNLVTDGSNDPTRAAATPFSRGGTNARPFIDWEYRVVILDNHGGREADLDMFWRTADNKSIPDYYRRRGWIPDIWPAVPFRIVVRKFIGDQQVPFDRPLKAVVELKDTAEEFDVTDGRRRAFMQEFFRTYNQNTGSNTQGDDNCPRPFSGLREHPGTQGVRAADVIRVMPYRNQPVVDTMNPAPGPDLVQFNQLTDAAVHETKKVLLDLQTVSEPQPAGGAEGGGGIDVGIADFAFLPYPSAGDNYRFLISLVDGNQDIRDTQENGAAVRFADNQSRPIPTPCSYMSGRFVIWKRADIQLLVTCNGVREADLDWEYTKAAFRKCFLDVRGPLRTFDIDRARWETMIKQTFPGSAHNNNAANFAQAVYDASLYPVAYGASQPTSRTERFAQRAIALACGQTGLPDPHTGKPRADQRDGNGFYVFLCKNVRSPNTAGSYLGDRMFWGDVANPTLTPAAQRIDGTNTFAHEFGHARLLRHSHTDFRHNINFNDAGGVALGVISISQPNSTSDDKNHFQRDHDGVDAFDCLMAYAGFTLDNADGTIKSPCALCALWLRHFDRVQVQSAANYGNHLNARHGPALFHQYVEVTTPAAGGNPASTTRTVTAIADGGTVTVKRGRSIDLIVLGPARSIPQVTPPARNYHGNLINLFESPLSTQFANAPITANARVSLAFRGANTPLVRIRVTGEREGDVRLTFRSGRDPTCQVIVRVEPP
ncbi:MAG: hypothetical protein HRU76_08240 [Phycisphaeraceae bacterium]|nr:MAG: hypothetical protein HRU76_08240 [Phycisphaeraceae bacterium]